MPAAFFDQSAQAVCPAKIAAYHSKYTTAAALHNSRVTATGYLASSVHMLP
jgi:hypothetical protein